MLLEALLPIAVIIALGFVLARTAIGGPGAWELLERLTYYLFFPALLVVELADASVSVDDISELAIILGVTLAAITLLIFSLRSSIAGDGSALSSVYQGSIRFNTYIGLAVIEAIFGESGLRQAALCLLVYIPAVNVLSVLALSLNSPDGGNRILVAAGSVMTNPLVIACAVGLGISESNWQYPQLLEMVLEILSRPALPLGLLAVGAGIRFVALGAQSRQLMMAILNKMLFFPALVLLTCMLLDINSQLSHVLLLLTALPAPPSAYILARQLGGDAGLMANIISLQSLTAIVTLPLWIDVAARFF